MRVLYFGCKERPGHFLIRPDKMSISPQISGLPWKQIDAVLCPQTTPQQGIAKMHHKEGWTALAFWDNSIDHRPNSNSVFFYEDLLDFDEMMREFKEHFPKIFDRFKFSITEFNVSFT